MYPSPSRDTRLVKRDSLLKPEVNEKTRADRAEKARKRTAPARRADVGTPETAAGTEPPVPCERSCHAAGLTRGGGCRALPATAAASAAGVGSFHQGWAGGTKRAMQRRINDAPSVLISLERWGFCIEKLFQERPPISSFLKCPLHYNYPNGPQKRELETRRLALELKRQEVELKEHEHSIPPPAREAPPPPPPPQSSQNITVRGVAVGLGLEEEIEIGKQESAEKIKEQNTLIKEQNPQIKKIQVTGELMLEAAHLLLAGQRSNLSSISISALTVDNSRLREAKAHLEQRVSLLAGQSAQTPHLVPHK